MFHQTRGSGRRHISERDVAKYRYSCRDPRRQLCHYAFLRSCYVRALRVVCNAECKKANQLPRLRTLTEKLNLVSIPFIAQERSTKSHELYAS